MTASAAPDLAAAAELVGIADGVIAGAADNLRQAGGPDEIQVFAYDLAHAALGRGGRHVRCSTTARKATPRPTSPAPSPPTWCTT